MGGYACKKRCEGKKLHLFKKKKEKDKNKKRCKGKKQTVFLKRLERKNSSMTWDCKPI